MKDIQIDGITYGVPEPVANLVNEAILYRKYSGKSPEELNKFIDDVLKEVMELTVKVDNILSQYKLVKK